VRGWPWRHDLRRVGIGLWRILRAARAEPPDAGIGTFAAASRTAGEHRGNRYSITLACAAADAREVMLVLDVYAVDRAGVASSHLAYAAKRLRLLPRRPLAVDVCFRWRTEAQFGCEGAWEPADELWVGEPARAGFVSVAAGLRDATGRALDRAVIFQEVDEEAAPPHESDEPAA